MRQGLGKSILFLARFTGAGIEGLDRETTGVVIEPVSHNFPYPSRFYNKPDLGIGVATPYRDNTQGSTLSRYNPALTLGLSRLSGPYWFGCSVAPIRASHRYRRVTSDSADLGIGRAIKALVPGFFSFSGPLRVLRLTGPILSSATLLSEKRLTLHFGAVKAAVT